MIMSLGERKMNERTEFGIFDREKTFGAICKSIGCEDNAPAWPDSFGEAMKKWLIENDIPKIRTLSLFSGAGGLDIGFSDIGFDIVSSVEIEEKFCKTLELNSGKGKRFEHSKVNCIDIRRFTCEGLEKIDFIIGGPPCQTFSAAGRRANGVAGTTDARGVLFREYVRLLKELSPKGFLFENVYGIVGAQDGEAWNEILKSFSEVGYQLFFRILDSADYGVPQHRERLIIVGLKEGEFKFPRPTHGYDSIDNNPFYSAGTAIEGVKVTETAEANRVGGKYGYLLNDIPPGLNYSFYTEEMGHPKPIFAWRSKFSDFLYKADPNTPVRTIKASGGAYTGPLHWENRFFTCEEYKRLQTFPDDYQISGIKQIAVKQIGNSVPPQFARIMAIAIRNQVFGTRFPFVLSLLEAGDKLSFRKNKRNLTEIYRNKARMAIESLKTQETVRPVSGEYFCHIDESFKFKIVDREAALYYVKVFWGKVLSICVYDSHCRKKTAFATVEVAISVQNKRLGVDIVELKIYSKEKLAYTAAWKAFEKELTDNSIKADLVQLNGYYQTHPKLICSATFASDYMYGSILKDVVEGKHVGEIVNEQTLAESWNVCPQEIITVAEYLKEIGYEIRNNLTNPQIEEGYWLIPYAFPTLTNLSVQLWKKLR